MTIAHGATLCIWCSPAQAILLSHIGRRKGRGPQLSQPSLYNIRMIFWLVVQINVSILYMSSSPVHCSSVLEKCFIVLINKRQLAFTYNGFLSLLTPKLGQRSLYDQRVQEPTITMPIFKLNSSLYSNSLLLFLTLTINYYFRSPSSWIALQGHYEVHQQRSDFCPRHSGCWQPHRFIY